MSSNSNIYVQFFQHKKIEPTNKAALGLLPHELGNVFDLPFFLRFDYHRFLVIESTPKLVKINESSMAQS